MEIPQISRGNVSFPTQQNTQTNNEQLSSMKTKDTLQSSDQKNGFLGDFLEFTCACGEMLYRGITSIVYIPLHFIISGLKIFYRDILSYNRDKYASPPSTNIYGKYIEIPIVDSEKKKMFEEIISQANSNSMFSWNSEKKANYFTFLQTLDYFLTAFDTYCNNLELSEEDLYKDVFGYEYSSKTNRREFLKKCLARNIEFPNYFNQVGINGICFGYAPSWVAWVRSPSLSMQIVKKDDSFVLYTRYTDEKHWTVKNAASRFEKEVEKRKKLLSEARFINRREIQHSHN